MDGEVTALPVRGRREDEQSISSCMAEVQPSTQNNIECSRVIRADAVNPPGYNTRPAGCGWSKVPASVVSAQSCVVQA